MTRKTKIILVFVSIFFIVYIINRYFFTMYHSTTINGVVINKVSNPSSITLKTFNETASDTITTKIFINDQNVWNLIELNRFYFVTYDWKNNETPSLSAIKINDKFGELYGDQFNN